MPHRRSAFDTGPSPARLFVPVHRGPHGATLRPFVDPLGTRTGVGFSTPAALHRTLGNSQQYVEIGVRALVALLARSGVHALRIDPRLVAARPSPLRGVPRPRTAARIDGFAG